MLRFVLYLLTALDLALVVLGDGQIHPSRLPNLPPPPTFTPVGENNTILVPIGENVVVHENVRVTMDCIELIQDLIELGEANPHVTWIKNTAVIGRNATEVNVFISGDERYCIVSSTQLAVGGQLGTTGNYTCRVCGGDGTVDCVSKTSSQVVCGVPHIQRPVAPAIVFPTFIRLTCGQNVTVDSFINIIVSFSCTVFNGSEPWTLSIYKDGELTNYTGPTFTINNPTNEIYGTFTFVVVTEYCGSATVISRILQTVPTLEAPNSNTEAVSGETVTLQCIPSDPELELYWTYETSHGFGIVTVNNISQSRFLSGSSLLHLLTLPKATTSDTGNYSCVVQSPPKDSVTISETLSLSVLPVPQSLEINHPICSPSIIGKRFTFTFEANKQVQYTCSLNNRRSTSCNEGKVVYKILKKMNKQVFTVTASTAKGERVNKTFTFTSKYDKNLCQVYKCGDGKAISGSSANITFTIDDPDATLKCTLNGKEIRPCSAPILQFENLSPGIYKLVIKPLCARRRAKGKSRSIRFKIQ